MIVFLRRYDKNTSFFRSLIQYYCVKKDFRLGVSYSTWFEYRDF